MIKVCLFILAVTIVVASPAAGYAQSSNYPEQPRVLLDTTYTPSTRQPWVVNAGADLQAVINQAQPGDTILLQAGATFTTVEGFVLPAKSGSEFITIRTSTPDSQLPPQGTRVTPAHANLLAKIVTDGPAPAIKTQPGAHHYRFVGIEFAVIPGQYLSYGIIEFGTSGSSQNTLSEVPSDLIIDRCYIHGNTTGDIMRGVALNSARTAIVDSYISYIRAVGFDTQAIGGWNGPGPFKIVNNYLEAAGENIMFGGVDTSISNLTPSDIEIRGNHIYKPLSWNFRHPSFVDAWPHRSGTQHWTVKNSLELKHAKRVLIEGNLFENHWADAQTGPFLVITPRNQNGGNPWAVVADITIQKNWIKNVSTGIHTAGHDDTNSSQPTARILIKNNVFDGIGGSTSGGDGRPFKLISGADDVIIEHNTVINSTGMTAIADGPSHPHPRFTFRNNIMPHNDYGFFGSGRGTGDPALETYFPGAVFTKNALFGPRGTWANYSEHPGNSLANGSTAGGAGPAYDVNSIGFVNLAARDLRLSSSSPFKGQATDGTDMGVQDAAAVKAAADAAAGGSGGTGGGDDDDDGDDDGDDDDDNPPPSDTAPPSISGVSATSITSAGATISWNTNEASSTQVEYGLTTAYGNMTALNSTRVTAHSQGLSGLTADTVYNYRVRSRDAAGNLAVSGNFTFRTSASAPPPPPSGSGTGLTAQYYNDPSNGSSRFTALGLTRTDATVNFNWGEGAPGSGVQAENFSVRWTGQVQAPVTGAYTFSTISDDGVRLWVNGQLVINNWTNHAATTNTSAPISLTAGQRYDIKMEFYDSRYGAVARLLWSYPGQPQQTVPQARLYPAGTSTPPPAPSGSGLKAQYYNDPSNGSSRFTALALTRTDATVSFDWGEGVPAPGVQASNFSVRWTGQVQAPVTGAYTFSTMSDDGVRLWVNGQLVIDNWTNHAATTNYSAPINLTAGQWYDIKMEYYDARYSAVARLGWSYPGQAQQIIPQSRLTPAP